MGWTRWAKHQDNIFGICPQQLSDTINWILDSWDWLIESLTEQESHTLTKPSQVRRNDWILSYSQLSFRITSLETVERLLCERWVKRVLILLQSQVSAWLLKPHPASDFINKPTSSHTATGVQSVKSWKLYRHGAAPVQPMHCWCLTSHLAYLVLC